MSIYAIGDLHLSMDPKIDKPMDIYGGAWIDHAEKVRKNCESKMTDEDILIIAGDISWALKLQDAMADLEWIDRLPGRKICFKGNHDLWWNGIKRLNTLFESITFMQNDVYVAENTAICGTRGWLCPGTEGFEGSDEKIYKRELLRLEASLKAAESANAEDIIGVLHYPPTNDKKQLSGFTQLFEKYNVKNVVYGHLHGNDAVRNRNPFILNGVRYKLISLDGIDADPVRLK